MHTDMSHQFPNLTKFMDDAEIKALKEHTLRDHPDAAELAKRYDHLDAEMEKLYDELEPIMIKVIQHRANHLAK